MRDMLQGMVHSLAFSALPALAAIHPLFAVRREISSKLWIPTGSSVSRAIC